MVEAFKAVDYAFIMPMPTEDKSPTLQVIEALRPEFFADYKEGDASRWEDSRVLFKSLGTEIVFDDGAKLDSTTDILMRASAAGERLL